MDDLEREASKEASSETYRYSICLMLVYAVIDIIRNGGTGGAKYLFVTTSVLAGYWWFKKRRALHRYLDGTGEKVALSVFDALQLGLCVVTFAIWLILVFLR